jgi:hypothetical protein
MTQNKINKFNKKCAEFLNWEIEKNEIVSVPEYSNINPTIYYPAYENLLFHSDWNWIMEVVEAIESKTINGYPFVFTMQIHDVFIENPMVLDNSYVVQIPIKKSKKEAVVEAIDQFLDWYNQNK